MVQFKEAVHNMATSLVVTSELGQEYRDVTTHVFKDLLTNAKHILKSASNVRIMCNVSY